MAYKQMTSKRLFNIFMPKYRWCNVLRKLWVLQVRSLWKSYHFLLFALVRQWEISIESDKELQRFFSCMYFDWRRANDNRSHLVLSTFWWKIWENFFDNDSASCRNSTDQLSINSHNNITRQVNNRLRGLVTWVFVINARTFVRDRDNDIRIIGAGHLLWISFTAFCLSFLIEKIDFHECFIDYTSKWLTCERIPFYSSPLKRFL